MHYSEFNFTPENRYLSVHLVEITPEGLIQVPEASQNKRRFTVVEINGVAPNCETTWKIGETLVVEAISLEKTEITNASGSVYLVKENFIAGRLEFIANE